MMDTAMTEAGRNPKKTKIELVEGVVRSGTSADALAAHFKLDVALAGRWLAEAAHLVSKMVATTSDETPGRQSRNRYLETIYETSQDAIMLLTKKGFFDCNPRALALFGVPNFADFVRMHPAELSPPLQPCGRPSLELANERIGEAMRQSSNRFEWVHRRSNGEIFEADVLLSCFEDAGERMVQATVRDISACKRMRRALDARNDELAWALVELEMKNLELERLSMTDQLTGLFNRRKLDDVIRAQWQIALQGGQQMAVILCDLDHFKRINDTLGHQRGDSILREIAGLMDEEVRQSDVFGRWGGEEFMVVCPDTNAAQAGVIADRIRVAVRRHMFAEGGSFTCSFGVADITGSDDVYGVIRQADEALYAAKAAGRDRVFVSRVSGGLSFKEVSRNI